VGRRGSVLSRRMNHRMLGRTLRRARDGGMYRGVFARTLDGVCDGRMRRRMFGWMCDGCMLGRRGDGARSGSVFRRAFGSVFRRAFGGGCARVFGGGCSGVFGGGCARAFNGGMVSRVRFGPGRGRMDDASAREFRGT